MAYYGKCIFLNGANNVEWLKSTALKGVPGIPPFESFVLYGNEDSPERLELFAAHDPSIFDTCTRVTFDADAPVYCTFEIGVTQCGA